MRLKLNKETLKYAVEQHFFDFAAYDKSYMELAKRIFYCYIARVVVRQLNPE
jgi:hypothetical protein